MRTFVKVKSGDRIKVLNYEEYGGNPKHRLRHIYKEVDSLVYERRVQRVKIHSSNWSLRLAVVPVNVLDIL